MLVYGFLLVLLLRPSWPLLNFFAAGSAVLMLVAGYFVGEPTPDLTPAQRMIGVVIGTAITMAVFYAVGALIVWLRTRKKQSRSDKQLDDEMARIRAEIAVRDSQPPA